MASSRRLRPFSVGDNTRSVCFQCEMWFVFVPSDYWTFLVSRQDSSSFSGAGIAQRRKAVFLLTSQKEGEAMKVKELMSVDVKSCREDSDLATATKIMWDADCGIVPVVN